MGILSYTQYTKMTKTWGLRHQDMHAQSLSCVQLFVTPRTAACQAPLSLGFSRQEYWSGFPFPSPERHQLPLISKVSPSRTLMSGEEIRLRTQSTIHKSHKATFPPFWWFSDKESTCQCRSQRRCGFSPWTGRISWRRKRNPLQHSCLESPMDRGALQIHWARLNLPLDLNLRPHSWVPGVVG